MIQLIQKIYGQKLINNNFIFLFYIESYFSLLFFYQTTILQIKQDLECV